MKELNIRGFINEMSYKLTMQELENIVIDYQQVIIDFIVNNQYNYKSRKDINEVFEIIRSDKFFKTIAGLIYAEDPRIDFDMAYVLYSATHHIKDNALKSEANVLGYELRKREMCEKLTENEETNVVILISAIKTVRSYLVTPFFRTKEVENILENLPEILYRAYGKKYAITAIDEKVLLTILTKVIPDLEPEEFITACCKSNMDSKMHKDLKPFASRIQSFLYKICGSLDGERFKKALNAACNSIDRFNSRTNSNETLADKYLNFKLLEAVINSKDPKVPEIMKRAYKNLVDFKHENPKFKYLF